MAKKKTAKKKRKTTEEVDAWGDPINRTKMKPKKKAQARKKR